jgi:hypothetical protein
VGRVVVGRVVVVERCVVAGRVVVVDLVVERVVVVLGGRRSAAAGAIELVDWGTLLAFLEGA